MNEVWFIDEKVTGKPGDNKFTRLFYGNRFISSKRSYPYGALSQDDFEHWQTYGFVEVKQAVPAANVELSNSCFGSSRKWIRTTCPDGGGSAS